MKTLEDKRTLSKWFAHTANWFVLFVQTYEERRTAERLQKKLDPEKYVVFVPTKDYAFKRNGKLFPRKVPWLDGYIFIAADADSRECLKTIAPLIRGDSDIYKLLSNDGLPENIALTPHDKAVMTSLLDEQFNIPAIEAVKVDDKVLVIDRTLEGIGGKVVKVNKHKQTARIQIEMFGRPIVCEVMLEYVVKPIGSVLRGGLVLE
jgi:transcription antitermination factor NusG